MEREDRPYQIAGTKFLVDKGRALLADEMGLGKTLTVLDAISQLDSWPVIIFAIVPALYVWKNELEKWFDMPAAVYTGSEWQRAEALDEFKECEYPVLLANFAHAPELLEKTIDFPWKTLVCDEIEKGGLLNHRSLTYKYIYPFARKTNHCYLVTGTPMRKTPADLFAPLRLLAPEQFTSYWRFVYTWCITVKDDFGTSIERRPKHPSEFRDMLREFMIRRLKKNVMPELPPKIRQPWPVEMSVSQRIMYNDMAQDMLIDFTKIEASLLGDTDLAYAQIPAVKIMRLRQLLVTPKLLGVNENGGALDALPDLVQGQFDANNPVVVFTPFRRALPFIREQLLKKFPDIHLYEVKGRMGAEEIYLQWTGFQADAQVQRAFLCVIKSGASFELFTSSACFFLGYEWSVGENEQCEDRLHRPGQKDSVNCYYMLHKDTVDDLVKEALNSKKSAVSLSIDIGDIVENIRSHVS